MPSYCNTIISVNSVPSVPSMENLRPYFEIATGASSFDVVVKVPDNCLIIDSVTNSAPSTGACGDPSDYNVTIKLQLQSGCTSSGETTLSHKLNYREDPSGQFMNIYIEDTATGEVKVSKTEKKVNG